MKINSFKYISLLCFSIFYNSGINAQDLNTTSPLLEDVNLDGKVEIIAFGDSITRGVGDFYSVGEYVTGNLPTPEGNAGYPLRIQSLLGVPVFNRGQRGEFVTHGGIFRFAPTVSKSSADYVLIMEGVNDLFVNATASQVKRAMQALINMSKALGKVPILLSVPTPCCLRSGGAPFVESYNREFRDLAVLNNIALADVQRAFSLTCGGNDCFLLNLPEGLHPNETGYDIMSEVVIATLFGIDLFSSGGDALLAQALGLDTQQIIFQSPVSEQENKSYEITSYGDDY